MRVMRHLPLFRLCLPVALCSTVAFAQYKAEPAGAPPSDVAPAIAKALQPNGTKISKGGAPYCEIWFRADKPTGAKSSEEGVTLPNIQQGALLAVIHFYGKWYDRRGQALKRGIDT